MLLAATAVTHGVWWCAAATPAYLLLAAAYWSLRDTPYARILRPALPTVPLAVALAALVPGWLGTAARWAVFFVVAGWHHSALQALREWARFSIVIGPHVPVPARGKAPWFR